MFELKIFEQMFPDIPRWYCMTYSSWITFGIQRIVLALLIHLRLSAYCQLARNAWVICLSIYLWGESWVNPLPAKARQPQSGGVTSKARHDQIELSSHHLHSEAWPERIQYYTIAHCLHSEVWPDCVYGVSRCVWTKQRTTLDSHTHTKLNLHFTWVLCIWWLFVYAKDFIFEFFLGGLPRGSSTSSAASQLRLQFY